MLADAAEAQGDMTRALDIDQKAIDAYDEIPDRTFLLELVASMRRWAVALLGVGRLEEAISHLSSIPQRYIDLLEDSGIMSHVHVLKPLMAAMKVLAGARLQTGRADNAFQAGMMLADVEETEAILAGYIKPAPTAYDTHMHCTR